MPRRSRADLSVVVPLSTTRRPPPPDELTAEQGEVWRASVAAMPADWFGRETYPLLAAYCRHVCRSRWLAQEIDANADRILKLGGGVAMLDKLFGMAKRESRAVMAHARSVAAHQVPGRNSTPSPLADRLTDQREATTTTRRAMMTTDELNEAIQRTLRRARDELCTVGMSPGRRQ